MIQTAIKGHEAFRQTQHERRHRFAEFAAVGSNIGAIEAGARFAQGVTPFVVVIGAPGWGKTHLIDSVASYMDRQRRPVSEPVAASTYATSHDRFDETLPLLIDDAQDVLGSLRSKQNFRRLLERRIKSSRPTLVCIADKVSRHEAARNVPSPQDWAFQVIGVPNKREREYIVRQIADNEGVSLSRPIVTLVARHLCGDGRSIKGAVRTLKVVRSDWSRRNDFFEACGVLTPYIDGEDGWDPRDLVMDVVSARQFDCGEGTTSRSVSAFILVSLMGLSEYDVATFLGVSPTAAYAMTVQVKSSLENRACARSVEQCKDAIVRTLDRETC